MKKLWLILGLGLLATLIVSAVGLRIAAKSFVESEEFRSELTSYLEQAAGSVFPHAMARVRGIRLVGLASIDLRGVEIGSTKRIDAKLAFPRVTATPELSSLLGSGPVRITADGEVDGQGIFDFTARVPKPLLAGKPGKKAEALEVSGNLAHVDAVQLAGLLFSDAPPNPTFQMTRGHLTGTLRFRQTFGTGALKGRKSGQIDAKLENPAWKLAFGPLKELEPKALDLKLLIKDFALELRSPVVLSEKVGRATIGGALLLPERADRTLAWDLDVKTEGIIVQGSLAKIFKCKQPPARPHFTVRGPVAQPACR